jgi:hypothetical protein
MVGHRARGAAVAARAEGGNDRDSSRRDADLFGDDACDRFGHRAGAGARDSHVDQGRVTQARSADRGSRSTYRRVVRRQKDRRCRVAAETNAIAPLRAQADRCVAEVELVHVRIGTQSRRDRDDSPVHVVPMWKELFHGFS